MAIIEKRKHYVLIGPSGQQAGRKDHRKIAQQIVALQLIKVGQGGGIINLLLPKSRREERVLEHLIQRGYTVKEVNVREPYYKTIRDVIQSNEFIVQLAVRYEQERGHSGRAMSRVIEDFSSWVCLKLEDPAINEIKRIVGKSHPELLNMRKPDWWKKQLNHRVRRKSE